MKRLWTTTLGIAGVLAVGVAAHAGETQFTVVVQDYKALPPYSAYEDGEYSGFNRELLDLFAESMGYEFTYVALPVRRLFHEFVNGRGDLKYPDDPTWALSVKKDAPIVYSDPVVEYVNGVMVTPDNRGRPVDDIETLGLVAGWTAYPFLERVEAGEVKIAENNSYDGLLKQAIAGRIDGAYSNVASSQYYLEQIVRQPDALVFDESLPHVRSGRTLASISHPELIAEFNAFLKSHADEIDALKLAHSVEAGLDPD